MTAQEVFAQADERLAVALPDIQAKANSFFAANGRYWQALRSHAVAPLDGAEERPNVGTKAPVDQGDPWPLATRNNLEPMAYTVDVYDGPAGKGYVVTVTVRITEAGGPKEWSRAVQFGPETWWEHGWKLVPVPVVG